MNQAHPRLRAVLPGAALIWLALLSTAMVNTCRADESNPAKAPATAAPSPGGAGQPAASGAQPQTPAFDPYSTVRNICGFCHEDGGRRAGKGPQLMGTALTDEQIFNRIKFGKPGRMAAFGGAFNDDQIKSLVAYIRALKPRE
jgi:mono/diheme cytochrome c family protein